jgi:hypothetical protein
MLTFFVLKGNRDKKMEHGKTCRVMFGSARYLDRTTLLTGGNIPKLVQENNLGCDARTAIAAEIQGRY